MKKIKYQFLSEDGNLYGAEVDFSEANEEIVKVEAYNGEYTVVDDGQPEPDTSTTDDVLNALLGVTE